MINSYQAAILRGLQDGRHVYGGTVPSAEVDRRRQRNRLARKQRRTNRLRMK